MTERDRSRRMPIRSRETGDTLALVSEDGVLLWSKRRKHWEAFPISELTAIYTKVVEMSGNTALEHKEESA